MGTIKREREFIDKIISEIEGFPGLIHERVDNRIYLGKCRDRILIEVNDYSKSGIEKAICKELDKKLVRNIRENKICDYWGVPVKRCIVIVIINNKDKFDYSFESEDVVLLDLDNKGEFEIASFIKEKYPQYIN